MNALGVRPSFATGFAQGVGESEYPELWRGLVAAYDPSLGQTGGRLIDWSGKLNHGIFQGNTVWNFSKFGFTPSFDGSSSGIDCGLGFDTSGWTEMTVVCWAKSNLNDTVDDRFMVIFGNSANDRVFNIFWHGNEDIYFSTFNTDNTNFSAHQTDGLQNDLGWHQYVGVLKSPNVDVYIDTVVGNNPITNFTGTLQTFGGGSDGLWIGTNSQLSSKGWNGLIGPILIYNRGLIPAEISLLHQLRKQVA